jgi:hypothetical protein
LGGLDGKIFDLLAGMENILQLSTASAIKNSGQVGYGGIIYRDPRSGSVTGSGPQPKPVLSPYNRSIITGTGKKVPLSFFMLIHEPGANSALQKPP